MRSPAWITSSSRLFGRSLSAGLARPALCSAVVKRNGRAFFVALLLGCACTPGEQTRTLRLVDWPGRDGRPVVLDQPLRLHFDEPLDPYLRLGSFRLETAFGEERKIAGFEVVGSYLNIHLILAKQPNLMDGSLRPGMRHRLLLYGVPHLGGVSSTSGAYLRGTQKIEFQTLEAEDEAVFAGYGAPNTPLIINLQRAANFYLARVDSNHRLEIPINVPLDPSSLGVAILKKGLQENREISLSLTKNTPQGAKIEVQLPPLQGSGWFLQLPANLEGMGGQMFLPGEGLLKLIVP